MAWLLLHLADWSAILLSLVFRAEECLCLPVGLHIPS